LVAEKNKRECKQELRKLIKISMSATIMSSNRPSGFAIVKVEDQIQKIKIKIIVFGPGFGFWFLTLVSAHSLSLQI
jgi:hypothetical protein